jgi:ABC-type transport system involved in multi-copper enzyme maturation permease subunit
MSVLFFATDRLYGLKEQQVQMAAQAADAAQFPLFGRNVNLATLLYVYLQFQFAGLLLLVLATGGGCVSSDRQFNALPLYFSRPLRPRDYMLGKVLGLTGVPAAMLTLSAVIIYAQAAAYFYTPGQALRELPLLFSTIVAILLCCLLVALSMAAFSSLTKLARTATSLFIGFWFLTGVVSRVLRRMTGESWIAALSPFRSWEMIAARLMQPELGFLRRNRNFLQFSIWPAGIAVTVYILLFLFILRRNMRVVEVVK